MDTADTEDPDDTWFDITLSFAGVACPGCETVSEPGPCQMCGATVPDPDVPSDETLARQAAWTPLLQQASEIPREFDELPRGKVPVSLGQFATAMRDTDLFARVHDVAAMGSELTKLDLNDRRDIGSAARKLLAERIAKVRAVLDACKDINLLAPQGRARDAREHAIAGGRFAAEALIAFLRMLTSASVSEARQREAELQDLLGSGFPPGARLAELIDAEWDEADEIDDRVSRVLGRRGAYTDGLGVVETGSIFGAFAGGERPFARLAEAATRYFGHLLPADVQPKDEHALLILPAVTLGTLDRPLRPHRIARLTNERLREAHSLDAQATRAVMEAHQEQGPLLFAAASRIDRALVLLAVGAQVGVADDRDALDALMKAYLEIAESAYRTLGWLTLKLEAIVLGRAPSTDPPPTLGDLERKLAASCDPLCQALGAASDSSLRNAAAHAQWEWRRDEELVFDLRSGDEWSLEAIAERTDSLTGAVAGVDAGYACFLVAGPVDLPPPSWLESSPDFLIGLIVDATFGAIGHRVSDVPEPGVVVLEPGTRIELLSLFPPVAGWAALDPRPGSFAVLVDGNTDPILEVERLALDATRTAPEPLRDLAIIVPLHAWAQRSGTSVVDAARGSFSVMAKVVAVTAMQQLATGDFTRECMLTIVERARYARAFALEHAADDAVCAEGVKRLERLIAASFEAAKPRRRARILTPKIWGVFNWAEEQGAHWPPV